MCLGKWFSRLEAIRQLYVTIRDHAFTAPQEPKPQLLCKELLLLAGFSSVFVLLKQHAQLLPFFFLHTGDQWYYMVTMLNQ